MNMKTQALFFGMCMSDDSLAQLSGDSGPTCNVFKVSWQGDKYPALTDWVYMPNKPYMYSKNLVTCIHVEISRFSQVQRKSSVPHPLPRSRKSGFQVAS